ncbi:acylphosphatase 2, muscle type isoform X3 [Brachyhypopomus gauderio]|uniref:acylphosphatase 2, muscle type isoform X3 n=1 Tax=Brachyhypopomus gauderio TaxID=698409 RepID=UPI0040419706
MSMKHRRCLKLIYSMKFIVSIPVSLPWHRCVFSNERKGLDLGLVGWVKNTSKGTVMGQVQGPQHLVNEIFLQDDTLLWEPDVPSHHILEFEMSFIHQAPEEQRKLWLSKEGSPFCRISRAVFKNEKKIPKLELSGFSTRF